MPFSWKLYCCRLVLASKPQIWNFDDVVSIGRLREKIAPKSVPREFPSFRCLMDCPRNTLDSVLIKPYLGIPEVPVFLLNQPIDLQNPLKFLLNGLLVKCLILLSGPLFGNATLNRNPGGQHTKEISRWTEVVIYCCVIGNGWKGALKSPIAQKGLLVFTSNVIIAAAGAHVQTIRLFSFEASVGEIWFST